MTTHLFARRCGRPAVLFLVLALPPRGAAAQSLEAGDTSGAAPAAAASTPARASSSPFASPEGIYGLPPSQGPVPVLSFEQAMGLALQGSHDLAMAREKLVQAQVLVRQAWGVLLPRLTANVAYQFSFPEITYQTITQDQMDAQAEAQRKPREDQAAAYEAHATAAHADGDYNQEYADRVLAARARQQAASIHAGAAPDPLVVNPMHVVNGGVTFQMLLFNGRAYPAILTAYDAVKATQLVLSRAQSQALYLASVAYFGAVSARRLSALAEHQVDNLEQHLAMTQLRVKEGTLPALALDRAEVDLTRARSNLRTARNAHQAALGSLAVVLGARTAFDVADAPEIPAFEERTTAEELIAYANAHRPDVQASRVSVQVAERGRADALARWLPQVALVGAARGTTAVGGFQKDPWSYGVLVNASVPLYDGGERYNAWRTANSKLREAREADEQVHQKLELSVYGNLRELELRKANLDNQRKTLRLAQSAGRDARRRYGAGAATNLEVLDAEQSEFAAALDLANAELELKVARLALAFVSGTFNPPVADPGVTLPAGLSPVVALGTEARAVPVLAPAQRAARVSASGGRLALVPSAVDLVRAGLVQAEP